MQTEDNDRLDRLEQQLADLQRANVDDLKRENTNLQRENAKLREDLDGLRIALRKAINEANGVFEAIERQTEAGKHRFEAILGEKFTDSTLVDEITRSIKVKS